jgi:enolase
MRIKSVVASIIKDSRGEATIEVALASEKTWVKASVPSGKSKGKFEAVSHPAEKAAAVVKKISPELLIEDFKDIVSFDRVLLDADGTENKANIGANASLALSIAFSRLLSKEKNIPLYQLIAETVGNKKLVFPRLFVNLINAGRHAPAELKPLAFQEYLAIPEENSPRLALKEIFELIEFLKGAVLASPACPERSRRACPERSRGELVEGACPELVEGDEGGFVLSGDEPEAGLRILREAAAISPSGNRFQFGLDAAASSLFKDGHYRWRNKTWNSAELVEEYEKLIRSYDLLSIEDPFDEEAQNEWKVFTEANKDKIWIVADDLTVTNPARIEKAGRDGEANAIIIKPNQIGTVSEAIKAAETARGLGWKIIVSHRSGETMDDFIADFSYGLSADGLKAGSPIQPERLAKYQRLIEIEENQ